MSKYCIARILGNENTPRDKPGSRLKVLEFILKNEPDFPDAEKLYVINRIVDADLHKGTEELLQAYKANYVLVDVPWEEMLAKPDLTDRDIVFFVVAINATRNKLIEYAHRTSEYAVILDGDCMFNQEGWKDFTSTVDQYPSKYYSIPSIRIECEQYFGKYAWIYSEPLIAFRKDAELRFNNDIMFGEGNKLDLLYRLGHDRTMDKGHCTITGNMTKLAGYVFSLNTGIEAVETVQIDRMIAREISMRKLCIKVRYRLADLLKRS